MSNINDPKGWWHKQEVIIAGNIQNDLSDVKITKENGKVIFRNKEGIDITDDTILTYEDGTVIRARDIISIPSNTGV